jgi:hypothetical protein
MALTYLPAAQANAAIAAMFPSPGSDYLGLNSASPSTTGANEVSGGSYSRQSCAIGAPSSGTVQNTGAMNFTNMPAVTVSYFSLWSAASGGTYEGGGQLTSSLTVPSGATVAFAIGALQLSVQG